MLSMRRTIAILAALAVGLLAAGSAGAAALNSAQLSLGSLGIGAVVGSYNNPALTGTWYDNGTATMNAGSAFSGLGSDQPLTASPPYTNIHFSLGSNGRIFVAPGAAPASVTVTAPLSGALKYHVGPTHTIFSLPLAFGAGSPANPAVATRLSSVPFVGSVLVTVTATGWHLGTLRATGLTVNGAPVSDVTTTGSSLYVQTFPGADLGRVKMVTLMHVRTTGLYVEDTVLPASLTLTWAGPAAPAPTPEPTAGLLLLAGAAGLVGLERRRRARG